MEMKKQYFLMRYVSTTDSLGEKYDRSDPIASSLNKAKLEKILAEEVENELLAIGGFAKRVDVDEKAIVQQNDYAVFIRSHFREKVTESQMITFSITYAYTCE